MTPEEIIEYIEKGIEDDAETDGFGYFVCESQIGNEIIELLKKHMPKKGSWIRHGEPPEYVIECSQCGQKYFCHAMQTLANYCSMCGASMETEVMY